MITSAAQIECALKYILEERAWCKEQGAILFPLFWERQREQALVHLQCLRPP